VSWVETDQVIRVASAPSLGAALTEEQLDAAGPVLLQAAGPTYPGVVLATSDTAWLAACTTDGLRVFQRGATSWSHETVDDEICASVRLVLGPGGTAGLTWLAFDGTAVRYAAYEDGAWTIYNLPAVGFVEAPDMLGTLPAPLELIGAPIHLGVSQAGFYDAPLSFAPRGIDGGRAFRNGAALVVGFERGAIVVYVP
jgi:hypothetical protein